MRKQGIMFLKIKWIIKSKKAKKYVRESEYRCHEIKVTSKI